MILYYLINSYARGDMMKNILIGLLLMTQVIAEDLPLQLAEEGRLNLVVPAAAGALQKVEVSSGRVFQEKESKALTTDIHFPVGWWRWTDLIVGFTPASDGLVELRLTGPWGKNDDGQLLRMELLWDEVKVAGLVNGSFSKKEADGPLGWQSPWRPYPSAEKWPLMGRELGASWHGRPLVQSFQVKKGRRVRIQLKVRAAPPPDFIEPQRLIGETEAHRANVRLKRGVNLGNCWEAPPGSWGIHYDVGDIDRIAAAGFDHIRVPVGWHFYINQGRISAEFLKQLEPVLERALEKGMVVLLDWHGFKDLVKDPVANRKRFIDGWQTVSRHFKGWPPKLFFELLNEPHGNLKGEFLNQLYAETIEGIRKHHPKRILVVDPGKWSSVRGLGLLRLPPNDERIIVSFHCYDPFEFTHQGASWVGLEALRNVVFPGPPDEPLVVPKGLEGRRQWIEKYNRLGREVNPSSVKTVIEKFDLALAWSKEFGRPLHLGEFGVYQTADTASRQRYARSIREAAEVRGIPWCWWEWKAGFGCWDGEKNMPLLIRELTGK